MPSLVTIQPADTSHYNLIKSTWLKSFYTGGSRFCENIRSQVFYENHQDIVDNILKDKDVSVLVAQSITEPDVTVGYIVFEAHNIIHYMYVKYNFRNYGVAKELFDASGVDENFQYSHRTGACSWLIGFDKRESNPGGPSQQIFVPGKLPKAIYNPYLAIYDTRRARQEI